MPTFSGSAVVNPSGDYTAPAAAFADMSEGSYSSSDYPQMASYVTAASRLIDAEVGRWDGFFYPSTSDQTFYFDGSGEREQDIDEFVSITSVSVSQNGYLSSSDYTLWTLNTDYMVWPYNYAQKNIPITKLIIVPLTSGHAVFFGYYKAVQVVGVPGYSASPPDIVAQACKIQAVRWFMRGKQAYQDSGASVSIGGIVVKGETQLDPDVKALLWPLKLELS